MAVCCLGVGGGGDFDSCVTAVTSSDAGGRGQHADYEEFWVCPSCDVLTAPVTRQGA